MVIIEMYNNLLIRGFPQTLLFIQFKLKKNVSYRYFKLLVTIILTDNF